MNELVLVSETAPTLYEKMRSAIVTCSEIDELATIKDQAYALKEYARQRDDKELEAKMSEIRLRAIVRIGQLSRSLEKAEHGGAGGGSKLPPLGISKAEQLDSAGISTSTAHRYEELAAPSEEEEAMPVIGAAMETYFANTEASGEVPNNRGLFKTIRGALSEAGFEVKSATRPKREPKGPRPHLDWVWLGAHVREIVERAWTAPEELAAQIPAEVLAEDRQQYVAAIGFLSAVEKAIETRLHAK